jgi:DNA-binding transcriptional MerR regulator
MAKAAEAFRTISEVADDLGIQKHVLRFWEVKFAQIRPMKRGGGRRYYRPEDMELLRGIRQLLHRDGYTIKGVQKILREQGVDAVKERALSEEEKRNATARQAEQRLSTVRGEQPDAPSAAATDAPPRRGRPRGTQGARTAAINRGEVIDAVIAELLRCRDMLAGGTESPVTSGAKAERRSRRTA